ncbi:hypothetical protein [Mesorhizobium salmacidum]|uniref:Uncharacterized protein n=1 Tax=Mesorhizobium salmacidum TaxID=3015171 RepID=A0ABU8L4R5_9HYPH
MNSPATVFALVASRLLAGIVGSRYTRFAQFVRGPSAVTSYLGDIAAHREKGYLGHNPAGAAMVLALLVTICGIALTGWLQTTDAFWASAGCRHSISCLATRSSFWLACTLPGCFLPVCVITKTSFARWSRVRSGRPNQATT